MAAALIAGDLRKGDMELKPVTGVLEGVPGEMKMRKKTQKWTEFND